MESRTFYTERPGLGLREACIHAFPTLLTSPITLTAFLPCLLVPPVCAFRQASPHSFSRLGWNHPRDLEPEATSAGRPVWDFSSAGDGHCAQLILKAQLGGGSSGHSPQPPEVFPLEPRPRGCSWQWIARGSVRTGSQRVCRALRGWGSGQSSCSFRAALL